MGIVKIAKRNKRLGMKNLKELKNGASYKIIRIDLNPSFKARCHLLGIKIGRRIKKISTGRDFCLCRVGKHQIVLPNNLARKIIVWEEK